MMNGRSAEPTDDTIAHEFDQLIQSFYIGLQHEAKKWGLGTVDPSGTLRPRLETIYRDRYRRRRQQGVPLPGIHGHAKALGQLTALVFRDEKVNDSPIDPPGATAVESRHLDVAREVYGHYMSKIVRTKMHHSNFDPMDEKLEETDQPCPLCT